jgi:uncharacterized membrane protein YdjX (TVP38/TMEM64 family)
MASFRRFGIMAVLIPSILPPPAPFKVFVLIAGLADISAGKFITAIAIGRGARYFGEGLLALRYGDRTIGFMRAHGVTLSLWTVAVLVLGVVVYMLVAKRGRRRTDNLSA